jgi:peptidoglycan/LPS O-acetylase OafA/YrhL
MPDPGQSPATWETYQSRKYLPELDGLRALSVLMVVSVHMHDQVWGWLGGWLGVSIFFFLSGYLITTLALREERQRGALSLEAFFIRRCFRIFPLYYVILGVYCLLILGLGLGANIENKQRQLLGALPWYAFYMQEVPYSLGIDGVKADLPFYQSWSLGIEEKFYLVWPVLVFVLWRGLVGVRRWGTIGLILLFATAPFWVPLIVTKPGLDNCLSWYYQILVGCLLALLLEDAAWFARLRFLGGGVWPWLTLGLLIALQASFAWLEKSAISYAILFVYTVALGPFLVSLLLGEGPIQRALRWEPLVFIGKLSYGIYLVHILCLNVAQRVFPPDDARKGWKDLNLTSVGAYVLGCAISVAVAWVLASLIEKPFIEIGRRWSKRVLSKESGALTAADKA